MNSNLSQSPLVVSIPHSGVKIPKEADWLSAVPSSVLKCDVDAFVDDLYAPILSHIPAVICKWHRYCVDMNRFPWDISPKTVERPQELFKTLYKKRVKKSPSDIHWHKSTKGQLLIKKPLSQKKHRALIKKYFDPYHKKIQKQLELVKSKGHQKIYLLDLHSMPSKALAFHKDWGEFRTEIVIGNHWGRSASKEFTDLVVKAYQKAGFKTALNWPYKGGAITDWHACPQEGREAVQIEINRKLYMDERTKQKSKNYKNIQLKLALAVRCIKDRLELLKGL